MERQADLKCDRSFQGDRWPVWHAEAPDPLQSQLCLGAGVVAAAPLVEHYGDRCRLVLPPVDAFGRAIRHPGPRWMRASWSYTIDLSDLLERLLWGPTASASLEQLIYCGFPLAG